MNGTALALSTILSRNAVSAIAAGESVRREVSFTDERGRTFWLDAVFSSQLGLDGKQESILLCGADVSERRQAVQDTEAAVGEAVEPFTTDVR
ncbi:hypothetical protein [Falsiroseomonas tokyonensis]|uniref:PAC domain-containing protein n=1 Tax=Falsiroseomonas tokyonensis TaxID=430521 RepID=A0ABV7BYS0_9PROT|nr:hypothetical protein [Falsiroseomonas tokyonensis]MBU8540006.1 hypothetical protein [Falsiroseomonas tokyonensis]